MMEFDYAYMGDSTVNSGPNSTAVSFAPDTLREPTFFRGELRKSLAFREAISALHDVVISDLRWHPKDRTAYLEWLSQQEEIDWAQVAEQRSETGAQLTQVHHELEELRSKSRHRTQGYYQAQRRYFGYLYKRDYDAWIVLDPVITVHPDEVFFECFSRDEASYGRLGTSFDVFKNVGEFSCGTTNIDYSSSLYDEFQKIRSYKTTQFEIDPSGFEVQTTGEDIYKEVKIDLPDSWVRGFLQVSSAMSLPTISFDLHPMDVHNICFQLRRRKEILGPRSMRYLLTPGEPIHIVFDPWNIVLECPRSIYQGTEHHEIRVWGRRRIHILERLIPVASRFTVHLLGTGMPSFYVADLGDMTFTLGLSGWTANDWSNSGNFDLMAPRAEVDNDTKLRVFNALKENWLESPDALAKRLGLDRSAVLGALSAYTQAGRAIFDLDKQVYRVRELSREPLPMDRLRFSNEREASATRFVESNAVKVSKKAEDGNGRTRLTGSVKDKQREMNPELVIDADERMVGGACTCNFHQQNKLRQGPCEHMIALRMQFAKDKDRGGMRFRLWPKT